MVRVAQIPGRRAKLAKYRTELIEGSSKKGPAGEGFDVMKSGDARVAMIGFPSVGANLSSLRSSSLTLCVSAGKSSLLSTVTPTHSEMAAYEFTTLTCMYAALLCDVG